MNLYTSYYARWRPGLGVPVVTSLTRPKWIEGAGGWPSLWPATPRWRYFHDGPEDFATAYTGQLDRAGPDQIRGLLTDIAARTHADRLILMCWEADHEKCHRWLLAQWWHERTGDEIPELAP